MIEAARPQDYTSWLLDCCEAGSLPDAQRELLEANEEINFEKVDKKNGKTMLGWAILSGKPELVSLVLARGASTNTKTKHPAASERCAVLPLHLAAFMGSISTVQLLLAHGAQVAALDHAAV